MYNKKHLIIITTTFTIFFLEAMIHYNIGYNKKKKKDYHFDIFHLSRNRITIFNFDIYFPSSYDLFKIILTVLFFSTLNAYTSHYFIKKITS
jgi:hypothetical protein